jgi:hypothetical protein
MVTLPKLLLEVELIQQPVALSLKDPKPLNKLAQAKAIDSNNQKEQTIIKEATHLKWTKKILNFDLIIFI